MGTRNHRLPHRQWTELDSLRVGKVDWIQFSDVGTLYLSCPAGNANPADAGKLRLDREQRFFIKRRSASERWYAAHNVPGPARSDSPSTTGVNDMSKRARLEQEAEARLNERRAVEVVEDAVGEWLKVIVQNHRNSMVDEPLRSIRD